MLQFASNPRPMLVENREATAKRIIDILMANSGHEALGRVEDEDGVRRDVWLRVSQGNTHGLQIIQPYPGRCVAVDIDTEDRIGLGDDLAGIVPALVDRFGTRDLNEVWTLMNEMGSRA